MFENYVNVIFSDILPHNIKTFYAYAQREDFSFWHGFYSCSICKVVMRLTSDTNDFVKDKSHARKKTSARRVLSKGPVVKHTN